MKVSYNWLQEYVEVSASPEELAKQLTSRGVVVEVITPRNPGVKGVLVGKVEKMEKHPNADTLWVCHVNVGDRTLQIVTGAQNVREGDLVPAAVPGAQIPGKTMAVAVLRGVESNGMLCSPDELGIDEGGEGIMILPGDGEIAPGQDAAEVLGLNDTELELDLTANYAAHCQAMIGVAQEVAALTGGDLYWPQAVLEEGDKAAKRISVRIDAPELCPRYAARIIEGVTVGESPAWLQARVRAAGMRPINNIVDVTNFVMLELGQPLHAFDYEKIEGKQIIVRRAGAGEQFTTLDENQRTLDEDVLVIADAKAPVAMAGVMGGLDSEVTGQTKTILLESAIFENINNRRTSRRFNLPSEAAARFTKGVDPSGVIRAMDRAAQLIAHLGGGKVVPGHVDVYARPVAPKVIPLRVSKVNNHLGLSLSAEQIAAHLERLAFGVLAPAELAADLASGAPDHSEEVGEDLSGRPVWTAIHQVSPVPVLAEAYAAWARVAWAELEKAGEALGQWEGEETLIVVVPTRRLDIAIEVDLVEEVARSEGYDAIPATLPVVPSVSGGRSPRQELVLAARQALAAAGLDEVMTYSLVNPKNYDKLGLPPDHRARKYLTIANPLNEDRATLRTLLLPSLLDVLQYNANRGNRDLAIFEVGAVYHPVDGEQLPNEPLRLGFALMGEQKAKGWNQQAEAYDFYSAKGVVSHLLDALNIPGLTVKPASINYLHPGRQTSIYAGETGLGYIGELHPKAAAAWDLPGRVYVGILMVERLEEVRRALRPYKPVPRFPAVTRDVSFVIDRSVPVGEVFAAIRSAGGALVEDVRLFDLYQGEHVKAGHHSLAYSITYRSEEKTLTDAEVEAAHKQVRQALSGLGAELRS